MTTVNEVVQIPEAFKVKTSHYMIAGLSLVVALSWNDTIKHSIKKVYPLPKDQVWASVVYSLLITLLLILVVYALPDTTPELPGPTQEKVRQAETADKINALEAKVNGLQIENEHLRTRKPGSMERMAVLRYST